MRKFARSWKILEISIGVHIWNKLKTNKTNTINNSNDVKCKNEINRRMKVKNKVWTDRTSNSGIVFNQNRKKPLSGIFIKNISIN